MNCHDVTNLLDRELSVAAARAPDERIGEHLLSCESCRDAWRAAQMLRSFAEARAPTARAGLLEETLRLARAGPRRSRRRPESFWLGGALGAALAASITLVVVFGLPSSGSSERAEPPPGLAIALYESRDITFAIDSAESLANARIHVWLKGGIELAGRPGQREIRWTADVNAGINRLTIPVVAVNSEDAEVMVEVEHGDKYRRFLVQVDVISAADAGNPAIG